MIRINRLIESGIYEHLMTESLYLNNEAMHFGLIDKHGQRYYRTRRRLKVQHLSGCFFVLAAVTVLSICVLGLEYCLYKDIFRDIGEYYYRKWEFEHNFQSKYQNLLIYRVINGYNERNVFLNFNKTYF